MAKAVQGGGSRIKAEVTYCASGDGTRRTGKPARPAQHEGAALGVKAPSFYRYFPHKEALEAAVAEEILNVMLGELRAASASANPNTRFRRTADAFLHSARGRFPLYSFVVESRLPQKYGSKAGKAVWNLLIEAASGVSGQPDDTAAAVILAWLRHP